MLKLLTAPETARRVQTAAIEALARERLRRAGLPREGGVAAPRTLLRRQSRHSQAARRPRAGSAGVNQPRSHGALAQDTHPPTVEGAGRALPAPRPRPRESPGTQRCGRDPQEDGGRAHPPRAHPRRGTGSSSATSSGSSGPGAPTSPSTSICATGWRSRVQGRYDARIAAVRPEEGLVGGAFAENKLLRDGDTVAVPLEGAPGPRRAGAHLPAGRGTGRAARGARRASSPPPTRWPACAMTAPGATRTSRRPSPASRAWSRTATSCSATSPTT